MVRKNTDGPWRSVSWAIIWRLLFIILLIKGFSLCKHWVSLRGRTRSELCGIGHMKLQGGGLTRGDKIGGRKDDHWKFGVMELTDW